MHDGPAPDPARRTVVQAHGAGAGKGHSFHAGIAAHLATAGLPVVRFDFPYRTAGRRVPDRMPVLQATLRQVVHDHARGPLVLMGKSMGGRVATMLADELGARACVVFGYPFHPPDEPDKLRTAHLAAMRTPTLVLQGERDEFGTRAEVATYDLSPNVVLQWFPDGDHSLVPRRASGCTAAGHFATACAAALAFARRWMD
ncbi:MAG: dienelactone hydrolase family protein [Planctomycetes bacterium]|nr:dienelactone hydrolase family protein [Planctomycetota bacterium]